ncbi:MAG TPA: ATP-binding cassette domain-containing protein [Baekduia sp.]|jgi:branched-chain amino acid transport system permease protein
MSDPSTTRAATPAWRRRLAGLLAGGQGAFAVPAILAVVLLLYPTFGGDQYWVRELSLIGLLVLVVSGVNLSFGYAGEVQFGQVFMYALGAYLTSILAVHGHTDIILLLVIGAVAASLAGLLIAIPALRIGGWSLAMASFFLVITIPDLVALTEKYSGGLNGLVGIPVPTFFGTELGANGLFYVTAVVAVLWLACYRNLVTSRYGIVFRVLRQSPILAGSIGYSPSRLKLLAYSLGALPAGLAGCLSGFLNGLVIPDSFGLTLAIGVVAASVLGGVESVYGAVVAAAILQLGPENSLSFHDYAPIAYGLFLIVAAVVFKRGLGGLGQTLALRISQLLVPPGEAAHVVASGSLSAHGADNGHGAPKAAPSLRPRESHALKVTGISKAYGGVQALRDVTLSAEPGCVTALIGSNGSGKTTLLNVICGYAKADEGTVEFAGARLDGRAPHQIAHQRVGRTFQTPSIPRGVSVLDVVASGRFDVDRCGVVASIFRLPRYWRSRRNDRVESLAMLDLVGLAHLADEEASALSLGTRRLVEVARALAGEPELLLLDEPASGLSEEEVELLGSVVQLAARAGTSVVLIEHNFRFVTSISDHIHCLHVGGLLASGSPEAIAADQKVIESYLGQPAQTPGEGAERRAAAAVAAGAEGLAPVHSGTLEVRGAVTGYGDLGVLGGIDLTLAGAGVELVLGRNGVGKTTLLSAISGQLRLWEGSVTLDGEDIGGLPAYGRAAAGIALVQEGKRIFRNRTVRENVVLGTYTLSIGRAERQALCDSLLAQFPVLAERADQPAGGLSGGQQQMLAIAQALASRPKILLLDEPSAGLAPAIVSEVFERVRALADGGMTVLLVEQLAEQALGIADHVTVIDDGRVVAYGAPEKFHDMRELQEAYFGGDPRPTDGPVPAPAGP